MSKPRVSTSEKEFKQLVESGAADFVARAVGYDGADELWATRTRLGALVVARGPEQRQHIANFLKGLGPKKFASAQESGFVNVLANLWLGGPIKVQTLVSMHERGRAYRGDAESPKFAERVGYMPPPPAPTSKVKAIKPKPKARAKTAKARQEAKVAKVKADLARPPVTVVDAAERIDAMREVTQA